MPPDSSLHKARTCERLARAAMATAASVIAGLLLTLGIARALRRSQLGERVPASAWRARAVVRVPSASRRPVVPKLRSWGEEGRNPAGIPLSDTGRHPKVRPGIDRPIQGKRADQTADDPRG